MVASTPIPGFSRQFQHTNGSVAEKHEQTEKVAKNPRHSKLYTKCLAFLGGKLK